MKAQINVLVTGVGGRSFGHQILHALLLAGDQYRLVVTDAESFSFGLYLTEARYVVPLAKSPDYLEAVMKIVRREKIQVILPGTEAEVRVLSAHNESLEQAGCVLVVSPEEAVHICANKKRLYDWLGLHGFHVPGTASGRDWAALVARHGFPIVGKPTEESGGSRGVALLNTAEEVQRYLGERANPDEVVFQEYVGSGEGEYTVGVLISRQGEVIDSIVMHRKLIGLSLGLRRKIGENVYDLSTGYSQGYLIRHPVIQAECERLALELGLRGPVNIQLRLVGDRVVIFEVHPRFSGTTSIRGSAGFNEPDVMIQNWLLGKQYGRLVFQTEVAAIRAFQHVLVPIKDMKAVAS